MAESAAACQVRAIALFVLLPLQASLHAWEDDYTHLRPHQALGYQIPAEFLSALRTTQM